jgi:flagellar motor protein MotB
MLKVAMIGLLAGASAWAQAAAPAGTASPAKNTATAQAATAKPETSPAATNQAAPASTTSAKSSPAQATASKPGESKASAPAEPAMPPTATVITIHGTCTTRTPTKAAAAAAKGCTTSVSKKQFDTLLNLVIPPHQTATPQMRRTLAQRYVELLAIADAAEKAGVEKSPEYQLLRLRGLAEAYQRQLDLKYKQVPPSEVDAYYNQHKNEFDSATLRRLYIPKADPAKPKATADEKAAFAKKAEDIGVQMEQRAKKGEDMDALEKDAYSKLGLTITPPSTQIGPVRKGALPAATDKQIFALAQGGTYKDDEPTAVIIYKVESKQTLPVDKVKDEIVRTLERQKMDSTMKSITSSVKADYNDKYFGPATAASAPEPPGEKR